MAIADLNIVAVVPPELQLVAGSISDGGTISGNKITWPTVTSLATKATVTRTYVAKGVKAGDARSQVLITTSSRQNPIEKFESTTVY
jgi:glutamate racemase